MPEEKTDASVEEILGDSESSTDNVITPNDSEEKEKENQEQPEIEEKGEEESEDTDKPFHKIKGFRKLIEEKNEAKKTLSEKDQMIKDLQAQLYEKSSGEKQTIKPSDKDFSKFDEMLDHGIGYKFKTPDKYSDITDLYKEFRDTMFTELFYLSDKTNKDVATKEQAEREFYTKQLDEVDQYFGEDKDSRNEFYKVVTDLVENKKDVDLMTALELYESIKPKKQVENDATKKQTLKAIGKGNSKPVTKAIGYDSSRDRDKSFNELASTYFN